MKTLKIRKPNRRKNLIYIFGLLVLLLISNIVINANAGDIDINYDFEYFKYYDYKGGNEYNNITYFNTIEYNYNYTWEIAAYTAEMNNMVRGDFIRESNNNYSKYYFDNSGNLKFFSADDIIWFKETDKTYIDRETSPLVTNTFYTNPVTFYWNNSYYLFLGNETSQGISHFRLNYNQEIIEWNNDIDIYDDWDKLYPTHIYYIDNMFYLFYLAFEDAPGSNPDIQNGYLANSTDLINWNKIENFEVNNTTIFCEDKSIWDIQLYKDYNDDAGNYTIYISFSDEPFPNKQHIGMGGHRYYTTNNFTNSTSLIYIGCENSTSNLTYNYIPIGDNVYRVHFDFNINKYVIMFYRGNNPLYYDNNAYIKMYFKGFIEYANLDNSTIDLHDYFLIYNQAQLPVFDNEYSIPGHSFYMRINTFESNFKNPYSELIIDVDLYIKASSQEPAYTLYIYFQPNYVYPYDTIYSFVYSKDYLRYFAKGAATIGTITYQRTNWFLTGRDNRNSYDIEINYDPENVPLVQLLLTTSWLDYIPYIAMLSGVFVAISDRYRKYGIILFIIGIGGLLGSGILGIFEIFL